MKISFLDEIVECLCRQRIDIDFERTDVKSRFNWINRAAIHYLNKTAFWNLAQYK